jgi:hypothetical protein
MSADIEKGPPARQRGPNHKSQTPQTYTVETENQAPTFEAG